MTNRDRHAPRRMNLLPRRSFAADRKLQNTKQRNRNENFTFTFFFN